jgi:hypothetical protein
MDKLHNIVFKGINSILTSNWIVVLHSVYDVLSTTWYFYHALYEFIILESSYSSMNLFPYDKWAKVQIYSLSLIFKLWSLPHYRSASFQQDMKDNLKNVAIPGNLHLLTSFFW